MNTTTNLGLKKPQKAAGDPIDIDVLNDNSDIIDNFAGITTEKLAADEAALAEVVDGGDKNKFTKSSDTVTSSGLWSATSGLTGIKAGITYIMSFENLTSTDTDSTTIQIRFSNSGDSYQVYKQCERGQNVYISFTPEQDVTDVRIYKARTYSYGDGDEMSFSGAMICTAADWAISQKFVPYCPSMQEMYQMILALQNGTRSAPALAKAEPEEIKEPETGEAGEEGKEER